MELLTDYQPITLIVVVTILALYECIFTGIHLVFKKSVRYQANRYLGILLFIPASIILPGFLFQVQLLDNFPHVVHIHFPMYLLFGPIASFYVRACTQKDFKMRPIHWLHFIPAVIALLYFFPFYLQSGAEKVEAFILWRNTGSMDIPNWIMSIRMLHPIIYFFICLRLVFLYRTHLDNNTSLIDAAFHRWLLYFSIILLLPVIGAIFMVITNITTNYELSVATFIFGIILVFAASIRVALNLKPSLFHVFPHQMLAPHSKEEQKQRYEKSTLQESSKEQYVKRLLLFIDTQKPYLSPNLTLAELSEQINIPTYHLSQVINEKLKCNFLDFINQYRVKEAQRMLIDPKLKHYTILSIAYDAGFNSKSTFYTAFKKYTAMTPSQYKKQELKKATLV